MLLINSYSIYLMNPIYYITDPFTCLSFYVNLLPIEKSLLRSILSYSNFEKTWANESLSILCLSIFFFTLPHEQVKCVLNKES